MDFTNIMPAASHLLELGSAVLAVVAVLTIMTTLIVEVIKGLFPKVPTNFVAVLVSLALTIVAMAVTCALLQVPVVWYYIVGAVVLGFFVAYAAMFGFDKFKEAIERINKYQK